MAIRYNHALPKFLQGSVAQALGSKEDESVLKARAEAQRREARAAGGGSGGRSGGRHAVVDSSSLGALFGAAGGAPTPLGGVDKLAAGGPRQARARTVVLDPTASAASMTRGPKARKAQDREGARPGTTAASSKYATQGPAVANLDELVAQGYSPAEIAAVVAAAAGDDSPVGASTEDRPAGPISAQARAVLEARSARRASASALPSPAPRPAQDSVLSATSSRKRKRVNAVDHARDLAEMSEPTTANSRDTTCQSVTGGASTRKKRRKRKAPPPGHAAHLLSFDDGE
ncbi:uncharacterized protein AMSG_04062 [Thecamonas trahens ATCC 50062]|uniref:DUF4604 domain-containing protein n=1 Tax=Thecamonas trahens ATCC 50062 TaxID=461836 RepID=A0A0L0D953_THETB|nr:hypothetical protein AMSG_04062 [Thecamonas trahens ATCC 50062]KNC47833.1 hypothetical protein AMSG_04062 [Thecamonas trahens ATCC 50062]|eukprot:XP_013759311.1 hypothetical protein AMSG_04062 [Thecamonas trahens ATCC 50062]